MRRAIFTNQFEKDTQLMRKRGKDISKLRAMVLRLANEDPLEQHYRDHLYQADSRTVASATLSQIGR